MNSLLYQKYYRDKIQELFKGDPMESLFKYHDGGNLILWRWVSLVKVCECLAKREGALRSRWRLDAFSGSTNDSSALSKTVELANLAVLSPFFWAYLKAMMLIHGVLNDLSTWAEACPCHEWAFPGCPLRGRRAPECADGVFDRFLGTTLGVASSLLMSAGAGLEEKDWESLSIDWNTAIDIVAAELRAKTHHWGRLPWLLCGLALPEPEEARSVGRRCVELFDLSGTNAMALHGRKHSISKRFLSQEGPLRRLVDDFLQGGDMEGELREWVGALRLVKIVERDIEVAWWQKPIPIPMN